MPDKEFATFELLLRLSEVRSKIYSFLSSIYVQIPSDDFVNRLRKEDFYAFLSFCPLIEGFPKRWKRDWR